MFFKKRNKEVSDFCDKIQEENRKIRESNQRVLEENEQIVQEWHEIMNDKYKVPLTDEELSELTDLLLRVKYSKQFTIAESANDFIQKLVLEATRAEFRLIRQMLDGR